MFLKKIKYGFYMIFAGFKGIKYEYIKKFKGIEEATDYAGKSIYLWARFTLNTIGIKLDIKGKENIPKGPCVFIGNHTSILDIPIIYYSVNRTLGFISKKEVLKMPVIGHWITRGKCIALDRENVRDAVKVINNGVEYLKEGYSMMIFPEGTRSKDGKVHEFKKGSLKLATKAKVPIVPVSINGAFQSFEEDRKFKASTIKVIFSEPINTNNLTRDEEKFLAEKVQNIIVNNLDEKFK